MEILCQVDRHAHPLRGSAHSSRHHRTPNRKVGSQGNFGSSSHSVSASVSMLVSGDTFVSRDTSGLKFSKGDVGFGNLIISIFCSHD